MHVLGKSRIFNTKVVVGTSRFKSAWCKQDIQCQSACHGSESQSDQSVVARVKHKDLCVGSKIMTHVL